jgi:hypothetical protein
LTETATASSPRKSSRLPSTARLNRGKPLLLHGRLRRAP